MTSFSSNDGRRGFAYEPQSPAGRFTPLFTVTITHSYYTRSDGLCHDFRILPTPSTAHVLRRLGLVFRDTGAGFAVLAQPSKIPALLAWLRRNAQAGKEGPEYWSRLTFLMVLDNPEFVGVTALPIGTTSIKVNLYGSNQTAHQDAAGPADDAKAILPTGRFMGAEALYPVTGSTLSVDLPDDAKTVFVTDISGEIVIPRQKDEPVPIFSSPSGPQQANLDFSGLPYDLYTVRVEDAAGQPVGAPAYPRDYLYVPNDPMPMGLLDMLLTQPTADAGGIYPIPSLFEAGPQPQDYQTIDYRLPFDARSTYWDYYVVLQGPGRLGTLSIQDVPGSRPSGAAFQRDPEPAPLPNGAVAVKFSADRALPLRQNSATRLQLTGQWHDQAGDHPIQVSPLAVAPGAPVWPGPADEPVSGTSEMFVFV